MGNWELPRSMAERAREFIGTGGEPPVARPAATVILVRPHPGGFEVYAIRRARSMAFASGVWAFPGGGVDAADATADIGWAGPAPQAWGERLGLAPAPAQAVVCAAVRELFEETGVLLADRTASALLADRTGSEQVRQRLVRRETHLRLPGRHSRQIPEKSVLTTVLADHGLELRSDLLHPWARWITPEFEPRRYDTFFFLAELPAGQDAADVSGEADHTAWVRPADALNDPEMRMLPPTLVTLRELAGYADAATLIEAAASRPITTVAPRAVIDPDGTVRLDF